MTISKAAKSSNPAGSPGLLVDKCDHPKVQLYIFSGLDQNCRIPAIGIINMTLEVIGAGVGRTGTYSLKLALNELGFGPCFHMEEVVKNGPIQVPLWVSAVNGDPDWESIYKGYGSAVDWPTGRYYSELNEAYPEAKFILTHRNPLTWAQSFESTIYKLLAEADKAPVHMRAWLQMSQQVISENGFPPGMDEQGLSAAFSAHCNAVKEAMCLANYNS